MSGKRSRRQPRMRVKSIDRVERVGPHTYCVEATVVEDDRPRRSGPKEHEVDGFTDRNGKHVRRHLARNPSR